MNMKRFINCIGICLAVLLFMGFCMGSCLAEKRTFSPRTIKVSFHKLAGYHELAPDGTRSGYGYDFLRLIAPYANLQYEYVGYDDNWDEIFQKLEKGEIELATRIIKTPEREKRFLFNNQAIGNGFTLLVTHAKNTAFTPGDSSTYTDLVVGMTKGCYQNQSFEAYAKRNGLKYKPVYFSNYEGMFNALRDGRVNTIVSGDTRILNGFETILARFDLTPFYAMVGKNDKDLLDRINYAINELNIDNPQWRMNLYNDNFLDQFNETIRLTDEEINYLRYLQVSLQPVKIMLNPDRAPYAYINERRMFAGIFYDIWVNAARKLGIHYELVQTNTTKEYSDKMAQGLADVVFDCPSTSYDAEVKGYNVTSAFYDGNFAEIYRKGEKNIKTVAVKAGARSVNAVYESMYMYKHLVEYPSVDACIEAVKKGEADCTYMYLYTAANYVAQDSKGILTYEPVRGNYTRFRIAVKHGTDPRLYSIMSKIANSVKDEEIRTLITKHRAEEAHDLEAFIYRNPFASAGVAFFFAFSIVSVMVYQQTARRKEKEKNDAVIRQERAAFRDALMKNATLSYSVDTSDGLIKEEIVAADGTRALEFVGLKAPCKHDDVWVNFKENFGLDFLSEEGNLMTSCEEIRKFYNQGRTSEIFKFYVGALDEYYDAHLLVSKLENNGHIIATVFLHEITETYKEEMSQRKLLQETVAQKDKANAAKTEFMSQMSHDIRTPMNAIIGMTAIANNHLEDKDRLKDCLTKIDTSSKHLLTLINEVLDMSKIESGKLDLVEKNFYLSELVYELIVMTRLQMKEKEQHLAVNINDVEHENVVGDSGRIQQVFMNILSNAIKYTPAGGNIKISVSEQATSKNDVGCYIWVFEDDGIGISREFLEKIFDPFTRAEDSRTSKIQGTGLGMSIAKSIVQMMGGTIEVESELNKGSKFTVTMYLKFQDEQVQEEKVLAKQGTIDFSRKRALVVEDNEINAEIAGEILSETGMQVEYASNGKEAVQKFRENPEGYYDIIFMDVQMPVMNGYEATRTIRNLPGDYPKKIPIFAMTANAFNEDVQNSYNAGMNEHISKPLDISQLMDCLKKWL